MGVLNPLVRDQNDNVDDETAPAEHLALAVAGQAYTGKILYRYRPCALAGPLHARAGSWSLTRAVAEGSTLNQIQVPARGPAQGLELV